MATSVSAQAPVIVREFHLEPEDNLRLAKLCGPFDENLRLIESRLGVEVRRRGNSFRLAGAQCEAAEGVLRELFSSTQTEEVTPQQVHLTLRDHQGAIPPLGEASAAVAAAAGAAATPLDELTVRVTRGQIRARGANQRAYLQAIRRCDLAFGVGPAGTGKTYLAVACAVEALQSEKIRRIVLVRPAVEAGERLGFLPGDLSQKVDPYLRPMYDALYEMMGFDRVAKLLERNVIEVAPLAFMRGRSLNESFIILDEAQNTTTEQMKMFLTRIGFGAKAVVNGDVSQIDLPRELESGLIQAERVLRRVEGIAFTHFTSADVVRHPLVARIVDAYERTQQTDPRDAG